MKSFTCLFIFSVGSLALPAMALDTDKDGIPDVVDPVPLTMEAYPTIKSFYADQTIPYYADAMFGYAVSGAGDVNGDGYADVVEGVRWYDQSQYVGNNGMVRIFSGKDHSILYAFYGDATQDQLGFAVSGAGDVNGDGYADVIAGMRGGPGGVAKGGAKIFSGASGSILYTFAGDSIGDDLGISVSGAGDVNGDGYADVIAGAYLDDNNGNASGSARVFSGSTGGILYTFNGDNAGDNLGRSVSGAGDVNGDGYADVMAGAPNDDNNGSNSGSVRIFSGVNGAILYTFNGDSIDDGFGFAASAAGDVNNDGYDDVIAGAAGDDNNGSNSGSARVLSGVDGSILYTFNGDSAGDIFGYPVSAAGDVNKDGYDDVMVGATDDDNNGTDSGSVRVFSGIDGSILYTFNGTAADNTFGAAIDGAGDFNNDGYVDLVAGAASSGTEIGGVHIFSGALYLQQTSDADSDGDVDSLDLDDDNDGIPDAWEIAMGLDSFLDDADDDHDGDGWTNLQEYENDTDPLVRDMDSDGMPDPVDYDPADQLVPGYKPLYIILGDDHDTTLGGSLENAGDVNNDGYSDMVAAVNVGATAGSVRVFSGQNGAVLYVFEMGSGEDTLRVARAGDVNGDGYADIIASTPYSDNNGNDSGSALVFSGANGSVLRSFPGDSADELYGYSVAGIGDINGDGYDDVAIGSAGNTAVDLYSGQDGSVIRVLNNVSNGMVSDAGDVNNDGYGDVMVLANVGGGVRVYSGIDGGLLHTFAGDGLTDFWGTSDGFGSEMSGAGDVNNDGYDDVMISAPFDDLDGRQSGNVRIFSGQDGALLYFLGGGSSQSYFGAAIDEAGDINKDGYADVVIGSYAESKNGSSSGSVRVFSGKDASILYLFTGEGLNDYFGSSVGGGGDVNDDGYPDLLIGATENVGGSVGGRIVVYSGALFLDQSLDADSDGLVNTLDPDDDNDGVMDMEDDFPFDNSESVDTDGDGVGDNGDLCPGKASSNQLDTDGDGFGDACEVDVSEVALKKELFGTVVTTGDMDGDGFDDLIVGMPQASATVNGKLLRGAGAVRIISGATGELIRTLYGTTAKQAFGAGIAVIPDETSDDIPDLIIGSPLSDYVLTFPGLSDEVIRDTGDISLYSGADGALVYNIVIGQGKERLGAPIQVMNGDLVVGVPSADVYVNGTLLKDAGQVIVYSGLGEGEQYRRDGTQAKELFGSALAYDSINQLMLVGSPGFDVLLPVKLTDVGRVQIFLGADISGTTPAIFTEEGTAKGDKFGSAIASFNQDLDGDTEIDWVVGIPGADILNPLTNKIMKDVGKVKIYSATTDTGTEVEGVAKGDLFGTALAADGDINNDDVNDLLIGAPKFDVPTIINSKATTLKDAGRVEVISGTELF